MMHAGGFTMMDGVVLAAGAFAVLFFAAWLASPALRAWIERPKYRFQANVQDYDQSTANGGDHSASSARDPGQRDLE